MLACVLPSLVKCGESCELLRKRQQSCRTPKWGRMLALVSTGCRKAGTMWLRRGLIGLDQQLAVGRMQTDICACVASVARMPVRSVVTGDSSLLQCAPPSVVRRIVPEAPTIQQTFPVGAEPANRLIGVDAADLWYPRRTFVPGTFKRAGAGPIRQACFPFGVQKTWGFCRAAATHRCVFLGASIRESLGAAETSTDSERAEIASAFAAIALGGERHIVVVRSGRRRRRGPVQRSTEPAWPPTDCETLPASAMTSWAREEVVVVAVQLEDA